MKHCILVKFFPSFNLDKELVNIKEIFESIPPKIVNFVEYIRNCINRENRYDLLIRIDMDKDSLEAYDNCPQHKKWKEQYSSSIEKKAIFDYE